MKSVFRQNEKADEAKLIAIEERQIGNVSWTVYRSYLVAVGGVLALLLLCFVLVATEAARVGGSFWLSHWSNAVTSSGPANTAGYYLGIYAALSLALVVTQLIASVILALGAIRASRVIHGRLMDAILRAPYVACGVPGACVLMPR